MGYTNRGAPDGGNISVRDVAKSFVEVDAVIVGQLSFHHHVAMYPIAEAPAYSKIVCAGLGDVQIVKKYANLDPFLCEHERRTSSKEEG